MEDLNKFSESTGWITSHYAEDYEHYYNAIVPPVFMNSLHVFDTLGEYFSFDRRDRHKFCYGRVQNPTVRILEDKIAALEKGVGALAFASGMAAASTAVLTACRERSHVVCLKNAYGPLKWLLDTYCTEHMKMRITYVEGDEPLEFEDAVTDETDLIVLESPSSVIFSVQDIEAVSGIAKKHRALVYVDNSFCTPIFQNPLLLGADIVMHTGSKYIGGHSDLIGGFLAVKNEELLKKLLTNRELFGGIAGPMEAWLMIRGLRTLEVRVKAHAETAKEVAEFLERHEKVEKVYYTGLASHPQKALVDRQQRGSTGLMSFELKGGMEAAIKFTESLKVFKIGVSWGGFESLVMLPFMKETKEGCREQRAKNHMIRIHCGLEGSEVLIEDLKDALELI